MGKWRVRPQSAVHQGSRKLWIRLGIIILASLPWRPSSGQSDRVTKAAPRRCSAADSLPPEVSQSGRADVLRDYDPFRNVTSLVVKHELWRNLFGNAEVIAIVGTEVPGDSLPRGLDAVELDLVATDPSWGPYEIGAPVVNIVADDSARISLGTARGDIRVGTTDQGSTFLYTVPVPRGALLRLGAARKAKARIGQSEVDLGKIIGLIPGLVRVLVCGATG